MRLREDQDAALRWPDRRSEAAAASTSPQNAPNTAITFAEAQLAFQKQWLENALQQHGDNLAATARAIGLDRSNLHRLLKKLGVR